ncbi:hypothetical protein D3C86_2085890 [compost metagenome]
MALTKWSRNAANFEKDVLTGLTFDITPIANELAQLNTFIEQYHKPLSAGVADDKVFAEMKSKAEPVVKKIQTELQKQADAFRKK